MKTKRFLLAAALMISAAACTGNPTASDATTRDPGTVSPSNSETTEPATTTPITEPTEPVDPATGNMGSGCCPNG